MLIAFTIYDTKTESFSNPFFAPTQGAAIRIFSDSASDPATLLNKHPQDFQLYEIGSWNDNTAELLGTKRHPLGTADQYAPETPDLLRAMATEAAE